MTTDPGSLTESPIRKGGTNPRPTMPRPPGPPPPQRPAGRARAPRILQHAMPPVKETDILRQCRDYLRLRGWYVIRIQQSMGAHKGISDLIAVRAGLVLWIEVKTPRGVLSEYQKTFRAELEAQQGRYCVVRSLDDMIREVAAICAV